MNFIRFSMLLLLLSGMQLPGKCQRSPVQFRPSVQIGIAQGENHNGLVLQSTAGVQKGTWFAGVGLGYDGYVYKSLPLFGEVRKFWGQKQVFYIYGSSGYNFSISDKPTDDLNYYKSYDFSGGVYTNFGVGFSEPISKKTSVLFSVGHTYKKLHADMFNYVCNTCSPLPPDHFIFGYGRIEFKTGILF